MHYNYFLVVIQENGKKYAFVKKVSDFENLLHALNIPNAITINLYPTRRFARSMVECYNNEFKANGVYMFDTPTF